ARESLIAAARPERTAQLRAGRASTSPERFPGKEPCGGWTSPFSLDTKSRTPRVRVTPRACSAYLSCARSFEGMGARGGREIDYPCPPITQRIVSVFLQCISLHRPRGARNS